MELEVIKDNRNGQSPDTGSQMVDKVNGNFQKLKGAVLKDELTEELGDGSDVAMSQKGISSYITALQNNTDYDYPSYLYELYIPNYVGEVGVFKNYNNKAYLGLDNKVNSFGEVVTTIRNLSVLKFVVYLSSDENYPISSVLAYGVISNYDKFIALGQDEKNIKNVNLNYCRDKRNSPIIQNYLQDIYYKYYNNRFMPMLQLDCYPAEETDRNITLNPKVFSRFLLDFKLEGVKEDGFTYKFYFQYDKNGSYTYSNYIAVQRINNLDSSSETIAALYIGKTPPTQRQKFIIPITATTTITKAIALVDFSALDVLNVNGASNQYPRYNLNSYQFDQDYLFDKKVGLLYEEDIINDLITKTTEKDINVWQLDNDLDFFTGKYGYKSIGQYTKVLTENVLFSDIIINSVNCQGTINYKAYIVRNAANKEIRDCPIGKITSNTHQLLKEGSIECQNGYNDYVIKLDTPQTAYIGSQVVVYMTSVNGSGIAIKGVSNGLGNPEKTSNVALLCTEDNPFNGTWGAGNLNEEENTGYFNVALTLKRSSTFLSKENAKEIVKEEVENSIQELDSYLKITIPNNVYCVVGTELNIWNDTVSLSVDKGLCSPLNYQVSWICNKGYITDRCFKFIPNDEDANRTYTCTCTLLNLRNEVIDTKTFNIVVLPKNAITAAKNIVYFGDSLGASAATELYNNFNNSDKFSGVIPTMLGTRGSSIKYEAVGGYRWVDYATKGRTAYRIQVTGVSSASVGAKYSLVGFDKNFEIREVNIIEGTGNMLIEYQYGGEAANFPASGTLTRVSGGGDSSINFTGGEKEANNPLWNDDSDQLDIALYKQRVGLQPSDKIDAVSFQFGINDSDLANDLSLLETYISDLYNAFIKDNSTCKFIIGLTTSAGNDVNGAGSNYGANFNCIEYLDKVYRIRQFYLTLQNSPKYPNIIIAPIHLCVDRYYGYAFSERPISQRYTETEKYHNNYVHPGPSGYGQMADGYFATYIGELR